MRYVRLYDAVWPGPEGNLEGFDSSVEGAIVVVRHPQVAVNFREVRLEGDPEGIAIYRLCESPEILERCKEVQ